MLITYLTSMLILQPVSDLGDIGLAVAPDVDSNRVDIMRGYGHYLLSPRTVGLKFTYNFEL